MRKKKDNLIYLQHKLPWDTEWEDVESKKASECEAFVKALGNEPPHLVETEYRIIAKKAMKLRNKEKSVVYPVCIMSGSEIAQRIKNLNKSEE